MERWSLVRSMKVLNLVQASILQIGDNEAIEPEAKVLAVQREVASFSGKEGNLAQYPIYSREFPVVPLYESFTMIVNNQCDAIHVGLVKVLGVSTSAVVQAGSNRRIEAGSRVKHIRHYISSKHLRS